MESRENLKNQSGIALILVLGILAVLVTLATTFAFNMRLEQKAASNYLDAAEVDSIVRIGVEWAIGLLRNDVTNQPSGQCEGYDWNADAWGFMEVTPTFGAISSTEHKDLDEYAATSTDATWGGTDAQWIGVRENGTLVGRYAVLVIDEASKMNINTAGDISSIAEGCSLYEIYLGELPDIDSTLAASIVSQRYGANNLPGDTDDDDEDSDAILEYDGIDNNADGSIDESGEGDNEPDEFTPWYERDDDEPFLSIRQLRLVSGITSSIWDSVKNLVTVHSRVRNQYWDGSNWQDKVNINAVADVQDIYDIVDSSSEVVSNWHQKSCNIMDYRDDNLVTSRLMKAATWIYGVEPILINEVLCASRLYWEPTSEWLSGDDSDWNGPFDFSLAPATSVAPNTYYKVTINAGSGASRNVSFKVKVGQVGNEGLDQTISTGLNNYTDISKCRSNSSGNLSFWLKDDDVALPGDGLVSAIDLVILTCAEAVELYNISDEDIDMTGWKIDPGDGTFDTIPVGQYYNVATTNTISAGNSFVLTNDEELFARTYGEGDATWGNDSSETIPVAVISDWTSGYDTNGELAEDGAIDIVILNSDDRCVELADTNTGQCGTGSGTVGVSREKDDPTMRSDWADNAKATAQASLLYENDRVSGNTYDELYIKNHPFASIGEMADASDSAPYYYKGVRSGDEDWGGGTNSGAISGSDLAEIAERITTDAIRLDAETTSSTDWSLISTSPTQPHPNRTDSHYRASGDPASGDWEWTTARLQPVPHTLYIYGLYISDNDYLDVYVYDYLPGQLFSAGSFGSAEISNAEYEPSDGLKVGTITTSNISRNVTDRPDGSFSIQLLTTASNLYFDYLLLVPHSVPGKINLNTAGMDVLRGLPCNVATAETIYNSVHSPENPYTELGDVLGDISEDEFAEISNLVSVHSDVFKIVCLAQAIKDVDGDVVVDDSDDLILAEKQVEVIVDRSSLDTTSGGIKILSWKEITE